MLSIQVHIYSFLNDFNERKKVDIERLSNFRVTFILAF